MNDDEPGIRLDQDLDQLRADHRDLDRQIQALIAEGSADQLEIARLKKRKLLLKDRIQQLVDSSVPDIIA